MPLHYVPHLKERNPHLYAEGLGLIAARHGAAVIVRKNYNGLPLEIWSENPLAADEEIIAVGQSVHRSYTFLMT